MQQHVSWAAQLIDHFPVPDLVTLARRVMAVWRDWSECVEALRLRVDDGRLALVVSDTAQRKAWLEPVEPVSQGEHELTLSDPRASSEALGCVVCQSAPPAPPAELVAASVRLLSQGVDTLPLGAGLILPKKSDLEALGEFAAGAGHDINNPLATISGRVQLLSRRDPNPETADALHAIGGQVLRIRDMIGDLMLFARPPAVERVACDPRRLAEVVVENIAAGSEIALEAAPELSDVLLDPSAFEVVVSELLRNACEWSPTDEPIRLRLIEEQEWLRLDVQDAGPGFGPVAERQAFSPFYSGQAAGRGLGFGLCKVWRLVTAHGGLVWVESRPHQTTVHTRWPLADRH